MFGEKMKFTKIKHLNNEEFRRLTGIKRKTFDKMIEILNAAEKIKKVRGGKPNTVSMEDRLLMALEYLREYRTYFHISQSYGISESACFRNIRWIEDVLIKSKEFRLPGRKALLKSDNELEVILIDATESPIERPKKNSVISTRERKSDIP
jgi:hypothetical protein